MESKEVKRFKKLKYADRVKIEELLKKDCSKDEIADQLHVHRATIYREIARTGEPYSAEEAQRRLTNGRTNYHSTRPEGSIPQVCQTSRTGQCANANDPISVCFRLCK